jgi:23S rRNA (cytosine1962-C5)-methyltransferase
MPESLPSISLLTAQNWTDYRLIDSGDGFKLEQFGAYRFIRPEPQAVWKKILPPREWDQACAFFETTPEENGGHWKFSKKMDERWQMKYGDLRFWAQTSASRHLGVFPEQAAHWDWMQEIISSSKKPLNVLNLFGYTGMASLAAARSGAKVTHIDASKKTVAWARENQQLSGLENAPIRWIVDDALKFVEREGRRGSKYDGLILDPPKFGRGPKGEVWEFFKLIPSLLADCQKILSPSPSFVIMTAYAIKSSAMTLYYGMQEMTAPFGGTLGAGELVTPDISGGRVISHAIYARWKK